MQKAKELELNHIEQEETEIIDAYEERFMNLCMFVNNPGFDKKRRV